MIASTAQWIAAVRARETRRPDRLFADPFAEALAGEQGAITAPGAPDASYGRSPRPPAACAPDARTW